MFGFLLKFFGGGILKKILSTIDNATDNETERQRIKTEAVQAYAQAQVQMMAGPGRWLLALFAVPLGVYYASVIVYSMLFCKDCVYPAGFTIAALPPPLDQWSWAIVLAFFGYGFALRRG